MNSPSGCPKGFTWRFLEQEYRALQAAGYRFVTCAEYVAEKPRSAGTKLVINRVDVDMSLKKAQRLLDVYSTLGIKATFFIRLHAPEYNPFSFEGYRIVREILRQGHELGYHSEIVDQAAIWGDDATVCLKRDLEAMRAMFGVEIRGVASHGGMTGLNNLDFWRTHRPSQFGLLYEGYDEEPEFGAFQNSFYISDSEWVRWKCYDRGTLRAGDNRTPGEHAAEGHPLIYLLVHTDTYHERHCYE